LPCWLAWRASALIEKRWELAKVYNNQAYRGNPAPKLLLALQQANLRAITDGKELAPEFWSRIRWNRLPDVDFRRNDVLALWPPLRDTAPEDVVGQTPDQMSTPEADGVPLAPSARKRLAYIGALEAFVATRNPIVLARLDDNAVALQFTSHIETLAKNGDATPPLPRLRAIRKQVGLIRQRLRGVASNEPKGTAAKGF
jgi:hypothetical protein